jgi:hypothetical protein
VWSQLSNLDICGQQSSFGKALWTVQAAADEGERRAAGQASEGVMEQRRKAEVAKLRKRIDELGG